VPTGITKLALQDPTVGWRLGVGVPGYTFRSSSSHPSCDRVDGLDKIYFGPVSLAARWTRKDRKHLCEGQKGQGEGVLIGDLGERAGDQLSIGGGSVQCSTLTGWKG
jgi:hypothetical protein